MVNRLGNVLRATDIADLDRLSIILSRTCETEHDRILANEALSLVAENRAVAAHYVSSSGDMRH